MPNNVRINWRGKQVVNKARKRAERNLDKAAEIVRSDIVSKFPGGSIGNHAQPGGIPHVQTGHLKRNVNWKRAGRLRRAIGTGIGSASSVGYAAALEYGSIRMAARPYLRPALRRKSLKRKVNRAVAHKIL